MDGSNTPLQSSDDSHGVALHQQHSRDDDIVPSRRFSPPHKICFLHQILLSLIFFGSQLSIEFYSIYGILSLQYFGLPTYLVSLTSLLSGLLSLTLVPSLGAFSDRGPAPKIRKAIIQGIALCILLFGYTIIASSAAIASKEVRELDTEYVSNKFDESRMQNASLETGQDTNHRTLINETISIKMINSSTHLTSSSGESFVTVAGVLGILGLCCIDVSYDLTLALSKSLIVESAHHSQKTQILNTSTMVIGCAGIIMSCVGMLDLPHILRERFATDGVALTLILMCSFFSVVSILTFGTSMRMAFVLYRRSRVAQGNSAGSSKAVIFKGNKTTIKDSNEFSTTDNQQTENLVSDKNTSINSSSQSGGEENLKTLKILSDGSHEMKTVTDETFRKDKAKHQGNSKNKQRRCLGYPRNKYFIMTVFSTFLGIGCICTGIFYFSHTLTIEVYGGDPRASPGTPARDKYEEGIKMASVGFLLMGIVFTLTSFANTKLLRSLDHLLMFAFSSALLAATVMMYYVLKNVAAYLVMMATYGLFRCMYHIVPFANALKYAHYGDKKKSSEEEDDEQAATTSVSVGKITSLVSTTIPLHVLLLTFMGPAMVSYGDSWLPMIYIIGLAGLNAVVNVVLKIL